MHKLHTNWVIYAASVIHYQLTCLLHGSKTPLLSKVNLAGQVIYTNEKPVAKLDQILTTILMEITKTK